MDKNFGGDDLPDKNILDKRTIQFVVILAALIIACAILISSGASIAISVIVASFLTAFVFFVLRSDQKTKDKLSHMLHQYEQEHNISNSLINSLDMAIIVTDENGNIKFFNKATEKLCNPQTQIRDNIFSKVFNIFDNKKNHIDILHDISSTKSPVERSDLSMAISDNETINIRVAVNPITADNGRPSNGYIIVIQDITKAKTLDDERSEFVSVTSHELRTPLAVVEAGLSTLLSEPLKSSMKPDAIKLLNTVHERIIHLGQLVRDLATLAKAQGEFLDIDIQPIDPKALVAQVKALHQDKASKKGLNLLSSPIIDIHPVLTSPTYVREILNNFLDNAVTYTKEGVVTVGAENGENNSVRFWVQDSGAGISQSDQTKLFTKFFRAEDWRTRETDGTGLGLYISKIMAERIGAKVWCVSELKKGATFYLEVPPVGGLPSDAKKVTTAEIKDFANSI